MKLKCPHCKAMIDMRDPEMFLQLDRQQSIYLAAILGLVKPIGVVGGKIVFETTDKQQFLAGFVSVN